MYIRGITNHQSVLLGVAYVLFSAVFLHFWSVLNHKVDKVLLALVLLLVGCSGNPPPQPSLPPFTIGPGLRALQHAAMRRAAVAPQSSATPVVVTCDLPCTIVVQAPSPSPTAPATPTVSPTAQPSPTIQPTAPGRAQLNRIRTRGTPRRINRTR